MPVVGNADEWYVVEAPITSDSWVKVERTRTGELLWTAPDDSRVAALTSRARLLAAMERLERLLGQEPTLPYCCAGCDRIVEQDDAEAQAWRFLIVDDDFEAVCPECAGGVS